MNFHEASQLTEQQARAYLETVRWGDKPVCSHCGSEKVTRLENKPTGSRKRREGLFQCKNCRKQFTVTTGSIFEGSHIALRKWVMAFHYSYRKADDDSRTTAALRQAPGRRLMYKMPVMRAA